MPLSEHEQRVLHEIEASFQEGDPEFVARASYDAQRRKIWRDVALALGVAFFGLFVVVLFYTVQPLLALCGFMLMVGAILWMARRLRRLSSIAVSDFIDAAKAEIAAAVEDIGTKFPRRPTE